ncbi:STY0301 family protein [Legionella gratiana]|nr:STY0301 family protein [Legionella gratiana]
MKLPINLILLFGLIFCYRSVSATMPLQCPKVIKTTESLQQKITDWDTFFDDWNMEHRFTRVTFYEGHPKEHASLAPDNENTKSQKLTWTFNNQEIWIACGYTNTTLELIQKLPDRTKKCTIMYNTDFSQVIAIDCESN